MAIQYVNYVSRIMTAGEVAKACKAFKAQQLRKEKAKTDKAVQDV